MDGRRPGERHECSEDDERRHTLDGKSADEYGEQTDVGYRCYCGAGSPSSRGRQIRDTAIATITIAIVTATPF